MFKLCNEKGSIASTKSLAKSVTHIMRKAVWKALNGSQARQGLE